MNLLPILNLIASQLTILGVALVPPAILSFVNGEAAWLPLAEAAGVAIAVGGVAVSALRHTGELTIRNSIYGVLASWAGASLFGAVPYLLCGTVGSFTDAVFESVSGFTTTGASIIEDYAPVPLGIFLWRSITQWLGGMGIVLLVLVILPALRVAGMQLYEIESSGGPQATGLLLRLRDVGRSLLTVYLVITGAETLALVASGMTPFDAINHAMATVATGGFGTKVDSLTGYHSPLIEWVVIVSMYVSALNFSLHYAALRRPRQLRGYLANEEWRWYTITVIGASLAIAAYLMATRGYPWADALTKGTFQVVSIATTTGFASDDYVPWGPFPQLVLLLLMILGGCVGSTAGGLKWGRVVLTAKAAYGEIRRLIHPLLVVSLKLNGRRVEDDAVRNVLAFVLLYGFTLVAGAILLTLDGNSIPTALGAMASAMGGVGPGLDAVGPAATYAPLSDFAKWILIVAMLAGRLELMTLFVVLLPEMWRR